MNKSTPEAPAGESKDTTIAVAGLDFEVFGFSQEHARCNAARVAHWLGTLAQPGGEKKFQPIPLR